jgi:hypothetical protein
MPPPYQDQFAVPVPLRVAPPSKSRRPMWVALAAVIVLALLGAGTAVYVLRDDLRPPGPKQSTEALPAPAQPTPTPRQPGLEPPRPGDWPTQWPKFTATDKVKTQVFSGLGFTFTAPANWSCVAAASGQGFSRYNCGVTVASEEKVGGEVTVRTCPQPCDVNRRDELRKVEEAWGQQWRFAGDYVVIAETTKLNGAAVYGLVVVAFFASTPGGELDRQLVIRMTGPNAYLNDIRRVANAARDTARF